MSNAVAVDFDGVLHDFSAGWTGYEPEGGPLPGAQQFIADLIAAGFQPFIHTARADDEHAIGLIELWMERWGFPRLRVLWKPIAIAYIDDRAVHCDPHQGVGFAGALADVLKRSGPPQT